MDPEDIAYAGVVGQRRLLDSGALTAVDLLETCLDRIARFDGRLNAFQTIFADRARADAQAADAEGRVTEGRPLRGIPVAVKDNVAIEGHAPSMGTGSPQPAATADAELVRRLRAAGAVIVGTTRLPELALWPFTESASWGQTRNPWDLSRTPGGSSGGSAAAVAAGMVAAAHASDGGGSIRIPAACCGLVGLKPQRGRVPLGADGEEAEHWHGLSVAGVLTRTVEDTELLHRVLTSAAGTGPADSPAGGIDAGPLRVGWSLTGAMPTSVDGEVRAALDIVLDALRALGHEVVQVAPSYAGVSESFLSRYARGVRDDLADLVDPSRTESRTRAVASIGAKMPDAVLARARRLGEQAAHRLASLGGTDLLVTPTIPQPAGRVGAMTGLRTLALAGRVTPFTVAWNVTGQPAVSIPAGCTATGLPVGVQLVGPPDGEFRLLRVAAELERRLDWPSRRPPLT